MGYIAYQHHTKTPIGGFHRGCQATATPPEPLQPPTVATMPSDVLQALQIVVDSRHDALIARIEAMEAKRGDNLQWFVFGIVTGVILIGVVAAIVLAGAWLGR